VFLTKRGTKKRTTTTKERDKWKGRRTRKGGER
jgi:hypothetical protein